MRLFLAIFSVTWLWFVTPISTFSPRTTRTWPIGIRRVSPYYVGRSLFPPPFPSTHQQNIFRPNHCYSSVRSSFYTYQISQPSTSLLLRGFAVFASITILFGYHYLLLDGEKKGKATWRSVQADTRETWSKFVRDTEGWLYAVQTLRNAITANTFLATTVLSVLTLFSGKLWEMVRSLPQGDMGRKRLVVQFTSVALCMLTSAYEFLQSARLMTHAGFMFPVAKSTKVDAIMRKSQSAQWLGLRWLYISLGPILWTIGGEQGLLLSSLALIQFFKRIDRVPAGLDQEQS